MLFPLISCSCNAILKLQLFNLSLTCFFILFYSFLLCLSGTWTDSVAHALFSELATTVTQAPTPTRSPSPSSVLTNPETSTNKGNFKSLSKSSAAVRLLLCSMQGSSRLHHTTFLLKFYFCYPNATKTKSAQRYSCNNLRF